MINVVEIIISPLFMEVFIFALVALTIGLIIRWEACLKVERESAREIVAVIDAEEAPERKLAQLKFVCESPADIGNAIAKHTARPSSTKQAVRHFISAMEEVPANQHFREGLRPSDAFIGGQMRKDFPRIAAYSDTVIRLSLIGTFAGLIAALSIASSNIGTNLSEGSDAASRMQEFLQQLLASAAVKFWISAVGLVLALILRQWQSRIDSTLSKIALNVGDAFDLALADPAVAAAWNRNAIMAGDPIARQFEEIAEIIKKNADKWVLSIQIGGGDQSHMKPKIDLIQV